MPARAGADGGGVTGAAGEAVSLHRRNPRRDVNETDIVRALEQVGVRVWKISGKDLPDILTLWRGRYVPMEIKSDRGKNRKDEAHVGIPWPVVTTQEEAFTVLGLITGRQ